MKQIFWVCATLLALAAPACGESGGSGSAGSGAGSTGNGAGSTGSGSGQPSAPALYGPAIHKVVFEIDYQAGAEPYTGSVIGFGDLWGVAKTNVARLFKGSNKVIEIPGSLDQMEKLTDISGADFTSEQILAIAGDHRGTPSKGDTATFYFLWLDGYYRDAEGVQKGVLGVSFGGTGIIAMFKPTIASTGSGTPGLNIERYAEQATVVHEFGHAAGLVNNGIAPASVHEDAEHPRHCTNEDCIQYWAIESTVGTVQFVQKSMLASDTVLWGPECLDDAAKATASAP